MLPIAASQRIRKNLQQPRDVDDFIFFPVGLTFTPILYYVNPEIDPGTLEHTRNCRFVLATRSSLAETNRDMAHGIFMNIRYS